MKNLECLRISHAWLGLNNLINTQTCDPTGPIPTNNRGKQSEGTIFNNSQYVKECSRHSLEMFPSEFYISCTQKLCLISDSNIYERKTLNTTDLRMNHYFFTFQPHKNSMI